MFDMTTVSIGSNLTSPMSGTTGGPMGNMTPISGVKFSHASQHSHSPMSTPGSASQGTMSNGKSVTNSNSKDIFSSNENELFSSKCKRKINFSHLGIPKGHPPATVQRRNARERNRVKQVNNGFAALKQHIPLGHRSKKMSKVETLRCAVEYIKNLTGMLDKNGALITSSNSSTPSLNSSESNDQHHYGGEFAGLGAEALAHLAHHHQQLSSYGSNTVPAGSHQLSPTSSEDPSSPSYASEASSYITSSNANMYDYENYEPVSPEDDEELLDAISWWQQS